MEGNAPSSPRLNEMISTSPFRMRLQATVALAVSLALWWRFGGVGTAAFAGLLAALALIAWVSPPRYVPIQRVLDFVARAITAGFSWFVLGLVYFGLFMPLRFLGGVLGRDPLKLKRHASRESYLEPLPPVSADRFKRQF